MRDVPHFAFTEEPVVHAVAHQQPHVCATAGLGGRLTSAACGRCCVILPIPHHENHACVAVGVRRALASWPFESHLPVSDLIVDNPTAREYGQR
jgi:hypothetical protein